MAKILPSELAKIELAWIGRCRELQAENSKLKDEIDELTKMLYYYQTKDER